MRPCRWMIPMALLFALAATPALPKEDSPYIIITPDTRARTQWSETQINNAKPLPMFSMTQEEFDRQFKGRTHTAPETAGQSPLAETPGVPSPADVTVLPYSPGGKLFFTTPDGDSSCSAEFVGESKQVFMTAAHCVVDHITGIPYTNFTFYRAWSNGGGSQTNIRFGALYKKWKPSPDKAANPVYDYAFFFAQVKSTGGYQELKMELPEPEIIAMGYPDNYEKARYMYRVTGSRGTVDDGIVQMNDNPLREGASGGAWICRINGQALTMGLNSFYVPPDTRHLFSPRFTGETESLFRFVEKGILP